MKDKKPWEIFADLEQGVPYINEETNNDDSDKNKEDDKNVQDTI